MKNVNNLWSETLILMGCESWYFCVISFITEYNFFYFRLFLSRIAPLTSSLHLSLSFDTLVAWTQRSFFSPLMVLLQIFFGGRPLFLSYHVVSTNWLFLRAWFFPFSMHTPTISTFLKQKCIKNWNTSNSIPKSLPDLANLIQLKELIHMTRDLTGFFKGHTMLTVLSTLSL